MDPPGRLISFCFASWVIEREAFLSLSISAKKSYDQLQIICSLENIHSPSFSASLARSAAWSNEAFFEPAKALVFFVVTCTGVLAIVSCDAAEDGIVDGLGSSLGTSTGVVDGAAGDLAVDFVLLVAQAILKQFKM